MKVSNTRNPGPFWGYLFLRFADRVLPEVIYKPLRKLGTGIAVACMPRQREASRQYLSLIRGRRATFSEVWGHFFAFEECLMIKLRLANGKPFPSRYVDGDCAFRHWLENDGKVMLGTMHIGVSDLMGFQLGGMKKTIFMVRQRVANSHDTKALQDRSEGGLQILWINDPAEMLMALKEAADSPHAILMQCDRLEHSARREAFNFLGARRWFPFSIYHLAHLFERDVILSFGVPEGSGSKLYSSECYKHVKGESRAASLARARLHFQAFLNLLEGVLREQPEYWFNFGPMNPEAPAETSSS